MPDTTSSPLCGLCASVFQFSGVIRIRFLKHGGTETTVKCQLHLLRYEYSIAL